MTGDQRLRPTRTVIALYLALLLGGCGEAPTSQPPSPSPAPKASTVSHEQLQSWITFRLVYGLRADLEWIMTVANDPTATDIFGPPLMPFEAQLVADGQASAQDLVATARGYSNKYPDEQAGAWIEGPLVVLAFSDQIAMHRAEVEALFGNKVIVREVQFSTRELQRFAGVVEADRDWFPTISVDVIQIDVEEHLNAVEISYRASNQGVASRILDRFGAPDWLQLRWDGPGDWTGPVGNLEVTVVDKDGRPAPVLCLLGTTDPRVQAEHFGFFADGRCFYEGIAAVKWSLRVDSEDETATVIKDFQVPPDGVERATVVIGP